MSDAERTDAEAESKERRRNADENGMRLLHTYTSGSQSRRCKEEREQRADTERRSYGKFNCSMQSHPTKLEKAKEAGETEQKTKYK